ncbi:MAG: S8 family peptidase, partial [Janthinobacterium lividum]
MSTFIILPARRIGVARDAVAAGKAGRAELLRNRRQANVDLLRATLKDPIQANEAFSVTGDQTDVPLMGSGGVAADVPLSLDALGAIILQNPDASELDKLRATGATVIENVTVYGGQPDAKTADTRDIPADGDLWHLERIGARGLHDDGIDGEGVLVGVIDTGVDADHPDLAGRIAHYAAFDPGGRFMASLRKDYGDHGTHVCGTIAGKVCGVAPGAKLAVAAALTTIDANGQSTGTLAQVLAAANWLIQTDFGEQNVTILNMSLGIRGYDDFAYDVVSNARSVQGILVVAAIGNNGRGGAGGHGSPGNYDIVLGVGATDRNDNVAAFSDHGLVGRHSGLSKPDLCAPGVGITSAAPGGAYKAMDGTSMAAPAVSGACALLAQRDPSLLGTPGSLEAA